MKDKKRKNSKLWGFMGRVFPYIALFALIMTVMIVGSREEQKITASSTFLNVLNDSSFAVTTDQVTESFMVADTASVLSLPSANRVSNNFVSVFIRYNDTGGLDTTTIEKPVIIDTSSLSRDIITYTVQAGDTLVTIAARFDLTTTQIRWSNNMRTEVITAGQNLFLPWVSGILYTVKADDTLEGIAERYQSSASDIKALNDLEISGLVVGKTIVLPNGVLPEKERPEYVPPAPRPTYTINLGGYGARKDTRVYYGYSGINMSTGRGIKNPNVAGQCVYFAWWWRQYYGDGSGSSWNYGFDSGPLGHAYAWVGTLRSRGYNINYTPARGAVVQTPSPSRYGHVAVVVEAVPGSHIIIHEMNLHGPWTVYESRIDWADAAGSGWPYIHGR